MSVEQKLTDKNVATSTSTSITNTTSSSNSNSNSKPSNNKSKNHNSTAKKMIKKALKTSKTKKTNKTTITNVNNSNNNNTDISNKTANNNNNNNKSNNTKKKVDCGGNSNNNNNNTEQPNDEIIEELFDFSDSDLKELDASNNENTHGGTKSNDNNIVTDISEVPGEKIKVMEMQKCIKNDNNNNKEQQQQQQEVLEELSSDSTADKIDKQTKNEKNNAQDVNETKTKHSSATTLANSSSILNLISNGGNQAINEHDKDPIQQRTEEQNPPKENDTDQQTINVLKANRSTETEDKTIPSPSISPTQPDTKSKQSIVESSGPEFISTNKDHSHATITTDNNNADSDLMVDDDDDGEYVEPYDELLVQFLDEANQIVRHSHNNNKNMNNNHSKSLTSLYNCHACMCTTLLIS